MSDETEVPARCPERGCLRPPHPQAPGAHVKRGPTVEDRHEALDRRIA